MYIYLNEEKRIVMYSDLEQNNFIKIEAEQITEDIFNNLFDYLYIDGKFIYRPIEIDKESILNTAKAQKREELKRIRAEKIDSDLEVNGDLFQVRERDLQNFYNLKIAVDIDKTRANEKLAWVLADNSIKEFSYAELMGVLGTYIARKQEIFTKFGLLTMQLEACQSVEEIEAIKWL